MKKIFQAFINIFKWYFLGIGYLCYILYLIVKNIFFYLGYLLSAIFYFLYSVLTLKFIRERKSINFKDLKNQKSNNSNPIANNENNQNINSSNNDQSISSNVSTDQNANFNEDNNQNNNAYNEITDLKDNININNTMNENVNNDTLVVSGDPYRTSYEEASSENIAIDDVDPNEDLPYETDLGVNKVNFKAEALNTENEGNLGYHVFVDDNNIAGKNNEAKVEKKIIKEAKTNKTAKAEEKVFKEIDEKQSFRDRLAAAFPTVFEAKEEKAREKEEAALRQKLDKEAEDIQEEFKAKEEDRGPKTVYEYTAKNKDGKLEKGYYEAYSIIEVQSYLLSEGYDIYKIRTNSSINFFHRTTDSRKKIKTADLVFFLTQLSTYLKAGITLTEAVEILSRQFKNTSQKKLFKGIVNNLKSGDSFSEALAKTDGVFPKLLVNMIKTSEMTGDLPETLDDMADYYSQMDKTRKQMVSAMTYPTIVLILAVAVIAFVLIYVIPKFTSIYASMDSASIPKVTQIIIDISDFIKKNYYIIMLVIVGVLVLIKYLYSNITAARAAMQRLAMKIPVLKDVIIYNEVTTFTKTFASLLKHGVYITDTMNILMQITNNEIYRKLIASCIRHLRKGENISEAFKGHWAFPIPAYEMIVTGERTGKLAEMLEKVSEYYQGLHENIVSRMKVIIEPLLIIMLTGIVGVIILAVIVPMFSIYSAIG